MQAKRQIWSGERESGAKAEGERFYEGEEQAGVVLRKKSDWT